MACSGIDVGICLMIFIFLGPFTAPWITFEPQIPSEDVGYLKHRNKELHSLGLLFVCL